MTSLKRDTAQKRDPAGRPSHPEAGRLSAAKGREDFVGVQRRGTVRARQVGRCGEIRRHAGRRDILEGGHARLRGQQRIVHVRDVGRAGDPSLRGQDPELTEALVRDEYGDYRE